MSDRRTFLRGLASLPLIGGGIALIGKPTAAAVPVSHEMLESYYTFLFVEMDKTRAALGENWRFDENHLRPKFESAKALNGVENRAAVILSAAGVPLT